MKNLLTHQCFSMHMYSPVQPYFSMENVLTSVSAWRMYSPVFQHGKCTHQCFSMQNARTSAALFQQAECTHDCSLVPGCRMYLQVQPRYQSAGYSHPNSFVRGYIQRVLTGTNALHVSMPASFFLLMRMPLSNRNT